MSLLNTYLSYVETEDGGLDLILREMFYAYLRENALTLAYLQQESSYLAAQNPLKH